MEILDLIAAENQKKSCLVSQIEEFEAIEKKDKFLLNDKPYSFSANLWDFSSMKQDFVNDYKLKFEFENNESGSLIKFFVIDKLKQDKDKIQTVKQHTMNLKRFFSYTKKKGFLDILNLPVFVFKEYIKDMEKRLSCLSYEQSKKSIYVFYQFIEYAFGILMDTEITDLLLKKNTKQLFTVAMEQRSKRIDKKFYNNLLDCCERIMENVNHSELDRMVAAAIILISQTGMRTGEFLNIKVQELETKYNSNRQSYISYMHYVTYKAKRSRNTEGINTKAVMTPSGIKAFNNLILLCKPYREKLGVNILFVTNRQRKMKSKIESFESIYRKFFLKFYKELDTLNTQNKYPNLHVQSALDACKKTNGFGTLREPYWQRGLKNNDLFVYPQIRQLRVNYASILYQKGVPIETISKFLNHKSTATTEMCYIHPALDTQKNVANSNEIYSAIIKDHSQVLGDRGDEFTERLHTFLKEEKLNTFSDLDDMIDFLAKEFPLKSKKGGFCTMSGIIPCDKNIQIDKLMCAFGMCQYHGHFFYNVDEVYADFLNMEEAVNFNNKNGQKRAMEKEINNLKYLTKKYLIPELDELKVEINKNGTETILRKYPRLKSINEKYDDIYKKALYWNTYKEL